jgi:cytochrome c oxidase subunit 3
MTTSETLPPEKPADVIPMSRGTRSQLTASVGMLLFLFSWGLTFAGLFMAYIILWWRAEHWPPVGTPHLPKTMPLVNTLIAVGSSVAFELAVRGARRGRQLELRAWMIVTFILGVVFLALQNMVWVNAWDLGLQVRTNNYAGMFYALTWFHAAHVACGLIMLATFVPGIVRGAFNVRGYAPLKFGAWFWHFVTAAWFCILFLVYVL